MNFKQFIKSEMSGYIYGPVYHGGTWNGLSPIKTTARGALGSGAYFTPDISKAKEYSLESGGGIVEANLTIHKPIIINLTRGKGEHPCVIALVKLGMSESKAINFVEKIEEEYGYVGKQISSRAISQGYDGILEYFDGNLGELVIWNSNQAKFIKVL